MPPSNGGDFPKDRPQWCPDVKKSRHAGAPLSGRTGEGPMKGGLRSDHARPSPRGTGRPQRADPGARTVSPSCPRDTAAPSLPPGAGCADQRRQGFEGGALRRRRTRQLMSPQRSVVRDPKLSQGARGEPVRIPLTGARKLNNPARDKNNLAVCTSGARPRQPPRRMPAVPDLSQIVAVIFAPSERQSGNHHRIQIF
jgi:hypothetical protein